MKILGIAHDVHICSAALIEDGRVVVAIPEERLDRVKMSKVFPFRSIHRCLKEANCSLDDIDEIAIAWNPSRDLETIPSGYLSSRRWRTEHLSQVPAQLMKIFEGEAAESMSMHQYFLGAPNLTFVDHYNAHLGNAIGLSGYENCAAIVMDGRGEQHTALFVHVRNKNIKVIQEVKFPHSIGLMYGAFTQFLGFKPDSDEWKVMALSAYAKGDNKFIPLMRKLIRTNEGAECSFKIELNAFNFFNYSSKDMYSDELVLIFGPPRRKNEALTNRHYQIASAMQIVFEEVMVKMLNGLQLLTGEKKIAVSGGSFMNSVFNGKIVKLTNFEEVFIGSCPDDSGTSVGAALWQYRQTENMVRNESVTHNYWGSEYSDSMCFEIAKKHKLPLLTIVEDPSKHAAQDMAKGKLVGWFQGRSEFGQRALGNRSILADPRKKENQILVNKAVKFRESFRPFAPAILSENVADYFECDKDEKVYFMEKVYQFKKGQGEKVPAVAHDDNTGRVQTVERKTNPRFYNLIHSFKEITGIPIVLNTSFNLNGEPNVDSPEDAIRTFYSCGLDVLYLGNVRISK